MAQEQKIVEVQTNVSQEFIAGSVQEVVKAAIVNALGNPEKLVRRAIGDVLDMPVSKANGKPSDSRWDSMPFIDWLVMDAVKTTVKECIAEVIHEDRDSFKEAVLHQLRTKKMKNKIAEAFIAAILGSAEDDWKMPITVQFEEPKRGN